MQYGLVLELTQPGILTDGEHFLFVVPKRLESDLFWSRAFNNHNAAFNEINVLQRNGHVDGKQKNALKKMVRLLQLPKGDKSERQYGSLSAAVVMLTYPHHREEAIALHLKYALPLYRVKILESKEAYFAAATAAEAVLEESYQPELITLDGRLLKREAVADVCEPSDYQVACSSAAREETNITTRVYLPRP